jgi:hypothetical protein
MPQAASRSRKDVRNCLTENCFVLRENNVRIPQTASRKPQAVVPQAASRKPQDRNNFVTENCFVFT